MSTQEYPPVSRPYPSRDELPSHPNPTNYAELYNLYGAFLDYDHRTLPPSEFLAAIGDYRDSRPPTRYAFTTRDICREYDFNYAHIPQFVEDYFAACECWPLLGETDDKGRQLYANPNYVHKSRIQVDMTTDERLEWAKRFTSYGTVEGEVLATMAGVTEGTLYNHLSSEGFSWQAERRAGLEKMMRTVYTSAMWNDEPQRETYKRYATAFGVDWTGIEGMLQRRNIRGGFEPPADPSGKPWYA